MQIGRRISLNAVRVFATVARTGSLTAAGAELGVTPSAVSHQLKKLEEELGVSFFRRGNNSVSLTDAGERFYQEVASAVALIERSADALYRQETEISVQASTSFAVRWLIPALDRFRDLCPDVRVQVETGSAPGFPVLPISDVSIRYFRANEDAKGWKLLGRDLSRPMISPSLLAANAEARKVTIQDIPALQCAANNWDWKLWCETSGVSPADLSFSHQFDTDDAALHACVAGLGMVLAPSILAAREIQSGALVGLPGYEPVEIGSYRYQRRSDSRVVRQFCSWIDAEARNRE
ncbi:LysR family transcriptional regulator [Agrobacterium vitis]|uniref:LysR family transcriptional regulator n=1 Tax=Rhizobium/Agrobacterium group TaxID=227290 RepID=UPI0012E72F54|nr:MULTISPECIES: LysR family transcriptional regulator [Rhizobium/Agrobacterium group]MCF1465040.1 LysR family transcriptional regulator [Allorhizobium ampelinum]MCF1494000.1 LysR family transcriptional regulator [Allorhizobium ampelinum]MVA46659.1 LysR family transcriptional regulator [Agrobacterium vitis]